MSGDDIVKLSGIEVDGIESGQVSALKANAPRFDLYRLRHSTAIVSDVIWLCFRFPLSPRMVEEMLAARSLSITDKLRSDADATRNIMLGVEHRHHKGLNNQAENSHQPTRQREWIMKRFQSPRQVAQFPFRRIVSFRS